MQRPHRPPTAEGNDTEEFVLWAERLRASARGTDQEELAERLIAARQRGMNYQWTYLDAETGVALPLTGNANDDDSQG